MALTISSTQYDLSQDNIICSKIVTTKENPLFQSGDISIIYTNKINLWESLNNNDYIVINSNGLTTEEYLTVKVTFEDNFIRLSSPSNYFDYDKVFSISTIGDINVVGKLLYCIREMTSDLNTTLHLGKVSF